MSNKFDIFVTVIITIITLIIGWLLNLISTKVTFKKTRELEKRKLLQTKIEEIAKLIDEIDQDYKQIWSKAASNVKLGVKLYTVYTETVNIPNIPFSRVQILIDFYFPELKTIYNELMKESKKFGGEFTYFYDENNKANQPGMLVQITDTIDRIEKICERIILLSSEIAQKLL